MCKIKNKKLGFTLAEVLITLTVLGVIAAVVIPSIIRNYQDRATVTKVKRAYAIIDNAIQMAVVEHGPINTWNYSGSDNQERAISFINIVKPYLPVKKECNNNLASGNGNLYDCVGYAECKIGQYSGRRRLSISNECKQEYWQGTNIFQEYGSTALQLKDGTGIAFGLLHAMKTKYSWGYAHGWVYIDINGPKKPNRVGYDIFYFNIDPNKGSLALQIPGNTNIMSYWNNGINFDCNPFTTNNYGVTCGNWIIKHGNVAYKYRNVTSEW